MTLSTWLQPNTALSRKLILPYSSEATPYKQAGLETKPAILSYDYELTLTEASVSSVSSITITRYRIGLVQTNG